MRTTTMDEQELEQLQALRGALARFAAELYEATHALRNLSTCLRDSVSTYYDHGAPFGTSATAVRIWYLYSQFTTRN